MSGPANPDPEVLKTSKWDPNEPMEEGEATPPRPARPVAVTEAFDRLEEASSLVEEAEADAPAEGGANQTMPYTPPGQPKAPEGDEEYRSTMPIKGDGEDDRSIEEYMTGLLQRAGRGYSTSPAAQVTKGAGGSAPPAQPPREAQPVAARPESRAGAGEEARSPSPYTQKPAPERRSDLSEMREVANINARTALDTHYGRQLIKAMYGKLILTVVCTTISLWLVTLVTRPGVTYLAAVCATVAGLVFGAKFLRLAKQLKKVRPSIISALEYDVPLEEAKSATP